MQEIRADKQVRYAFFKTDFFYLCARVNFKNK